MVCPLNKILQFEYTLDERDDTFSNLINLRRLLKISTWTQFCFIPGEDRWLCTLLLQQGYRVEYCAASDAYTYAPEGFNEYFTQRRRWTPSTMANVLDLLLDWKNVIKKNQNISCLYIMYQGFMMASSIVTPGTVFLLIAGAINVAFPDVTLTLSLVLNFIPVIILFILCFFVRNEIQVKNAICLNL